MFTCFNFRCSLRTGFCFNTKLKKEKKITEIGDKLKKKQRLWYAVGYFSSTVCVCLSEWSSFSHDETFSILLRVVSSKLVKLTFMGHKGSLMRMKIKVNPPVGDFGMLDRTLHHHHQTVKTIANGLSLGRMVFIPPVQFQTFAEFMPRRTEVVLAACGCPTPYPHAIWPFFL